MPKNVISPAEGKDIDRTLARALRLTTLPPGAKIEVSKTPTGEISVSQQPLTKQQLIAQNYSHLAGQGIPINEAAEKYDVPKGTIGRWVYTQNYVSFVDEDSWPKLVDEAEVALCAAIYHERKAKGITGIPFFDDDDFIIEDLKHPKLAAYRRRRRAAAKKSA